MEKPYSKRKYILFLVGAFLIIVLDFVSKWLVQCLCPLEKELTVINGFFYIYKSYNTGVAFSFGTSLPMGLRRGLNIAISVLMSGIIFIYWHRNRKKINTWYYVAAMLLLGGAIGNLIDRACYWIPVEQGGPFGVIDFFRFYIRGKNYEPFATFNVADMALTIGMVLLIIILIVETIKDRNKSISKKEVKKDEPQNKD